MGVVIEKLKQRVVDIGAKVRKHQEKVDRLRQNRMFQNNQGQFYSELNQEGGRCDNDQQDAEESKTFRRDKWSELLDPNCDTR